MANEGTLPTFGNGFYGIDPNRRLKGGAGGGFKIPLSIDAESQQIAGPLYGETSPFAGVEGTEQFMGNLGNVGPQPKVAPSISSEGFDLNRQDIGTIDTAKRTFGLEVPKEGLSLQESGKTKELNAAADSLGYTGDSKGEAFKSAAGVAKDAAIGFVTKQLAENARLAKAEYNMNMDNWNKQGMYWFDPDADLMPDIGSYMEDMPLATDAASKSTLTKGNLSKTRGGKNALGVATLGISGAFDDKEQAEYIWNSGGEGAMKGYQASNHWIGAIVGGAIGIVKGVFNWNTTEEADKEMRAKALKLFEKKLKIWKQRRDRRVLRQNYQTEQKKAGVRRSEAAKKEAKTLATSQRKSNRAQSMFNSFIETMKLQAQKERRGQ